METLIDCSSVDRERDVLVAPLDVRPRDSRQRRMLFDRRYPWNVSLGPELIDYFDDRDEAIQLAVRVSMKSGRPIWLSEDGVNFVPLAR